VNSYTLLVLFFTLLCSSPICIHLIFRE